LVRTLGTSLLLCAVIGCAPAVVRAQQQAPQVRVEMNADRRELNLGDNVAVRIYVQTQGAGQPDIEVPEFEGFQVVQRSVQRPMQFSFGFGSAQPVVTSTTQYTFVLVPMGAGTFKIPPVKVTVGQKVFQSQPLVLTVTGAGQAAAQAPAADPQQQPQQQQPQQQQPSAAEQPAQPQTPAAKASGDVAVFDPEAFLRTVVDKIEPYEGEQVTSTIYLYTRHNLQQVPQVQTEAGTDGFWVQDLLASTRSLEPTRQVINGRGFWVYVLRRFAGFPLRNGDLTIGSMALTIPRESVFDLFDPGRAQGDLQRNSVPVLLHVKPLPAENQPSGAVAIGTFELKMELDRKQVLTGDAVTLTATVRGKGNLRGIKLSDPVIKNIQVLQPEIRDLTETTGDRVTGTRTFAWLIVPQAPGSYQLPALTLDTFDLDSQSYKRIHSEPLTLTAAGAAHDVQASAGGTKAGSDEHSGEHDQDVWPPARQHSELARPQKPLASHGLYAWLLLLWPLLWLASVLGPIAVARWQARGYETHEKRAMRAARERLHAAERALTAQDPRRFHADIAAGLNIALEARVGEPVSGLTQNALRAKLIEHGLPDALGQAVCEVLAQCDFARFSSASVNEVDMRALLVRAQRLASELNGKDPVTRANGADLAGRAAAPRTKEGT
jgi:hypothetical protein